MESECLRIEDKDKNKNKNKKVQFVSRVQPRTINYVQLITTAISHQLDEKYIYECPSRTRKWYKLARKREKEKENQEKAMKAEKAQNTKARMDEKRVVTRERGYPTSKNSRTREVVAMVQV